MRYAVVIERTRTGYSGYVPDLPGCVAAGATPEETRDLLRGAIELYLAEVRSTGASVPQPSTTVTQLEVA
jgi:predicted RNase H-like HicB family nuclease